MRTGLLKCYILGGNKGAANNLYFVPSCFTSTSPFPVAFHPAFKVIPILQRLHEWQVLLSVTTPRLRLALARSVVINFIWLHLMELLTIPRLCKSTTAKPVSWDLCFFMTELLDRMKWKSTRSKSHLKVVQRSYATRIRLYPLLPISRKPMANLWDYPHVVIWRTHWRKSFSWYEGSYSR